MSKDDFFLVTKYLERVRRQPFDVVLGQTEGHEVVQFPEGVAVDVVNGVSLQE